MIAANVELGPSGRLSAQGGDPAGGLASAPLQAGGSGGSLWLRVGKLTLPAVVSGVLPLSAQGGRNGGAGRVRLERIGGDDPVARGQLLPAPSTVPFRAPQVAGLPLLPPTLAALGKKVTSARLVAALDTLPVAGPPLVLHELTAGGVASAVTVGPELGFAATQDLRFRAVFAPRTGQTPRTAGLVWRLKVQ